MHVDNVRADFDEIARLGDGSESGTDRFDAFVESLVPESAVMLLDVGCGTGRLTVRLAREGRHCVGLDLSPEMIRRARRRSAGRASVSFVCADLLTSELPAESFDCVVTVATVHHLPMVPALGRLTALLRPGGRLILHDLRRSSTRLDELGAWVAAGFDAGRRLVRGGELLPSRVVRRAWAQHTAKESYLRFEDVIQLSERYLPGASLHRHWTWRYTIVWDKPHPN